MKNLTLIILIYFNCLCCISQENFSDFLKVEIKENVKNKIKSVLIEEKANIKVLIEIYSKNTLNEINPFIKDFWMRSFEKTDLEIYKYKYKYYSNSIIWIPSQVNKIGFEKTITLKQLSSLISKGKNSNSKTLYYILSEPFFSKDKNECIVYKEVNEIRKTTPSYEILIYKKEKENWIFKETYNLKVVGLHE